MAVKPNNAGLPNVRALYEEREAKKAAAKAASTPAPVVQNANQRETRTPAPAFNQTLNVYGAPTTPKTTIGADTGKQTGKKTTETKAEIDARIAATNAKIDAAMGPVKSYVEGMGYVIDPITGLYVKGTSTGDGSGGDTSAGQQPPAGDKAPPKKEVIPNIAYDTIQKILESYKITGLAAVLDTIRDEYPEASSAELITLLQFDSRYNTKFNDRFAGNVARQKAGKPVLSPGEYLKLEQAYEKVFTSYNLPTFKTQSYYDSFITSDIDPTEIGERVSLAYDRVMNDIEVGKAFSKFYPSLTISDVVTGMLDTTNQLPALQQKVKTAEIGGAALRQGLTASELATKEETTKGFTNVTTSTLGADVLAKQGITKQQAEAGYQNIARILPAAEKLSSIYDTSTEQYGLKEAEQEQFQGLASAERKRLELAKLEMAQFSGKSGLSKNALSNQLNV
jgi:hypothetical protein